VAYATIDDIFGRFKPIRTMIGAGSFEVTSADVTSIFIGDADSFVDAYLAKRYVTPITPIPSMITQISSDLAIFNMMTEKQVQVPDSFQARYDRSIKTLEMLRDGDMILPAATPIAAAGDNEAWSPNQDYHSTFSPVLDELEQRVDDDWVQSDIDTRIDD